MSYCTIYKILSNDTSKKIEDYSILDFSKNTNPCFSTYIGYRYPADSFGKNILDIVILKNNSQWRPEYHRSVFFQNEEIEFYLKAINRMFKFTWLEKEDFFIIRVDERDFDNKASIRIFLDFLRITWEHKNIFEKYNDIPIEIKDNYSVLFLTQCLSLSDINGNIHYLPSAQGYKLSHNIHADEEIFSNNGILSKKCMENTEGSFKVWNALRDFKIKKSVNVTASGYFDSKILNEKDWFKKEDNFIELYLENNK